MHRRDLLKFAAASGLAWPLAGSRLVLANNGLIVFASYAPMSGAFAANGKLNDMGVQLSVQTHGTVLGRDLLSLTIDTEGKPATAVRRAQEAFEQRDARFMMGGTLSSEALAVDAEMHRLGGIMMTSADADEITGTDCNRATFRWSVPTFGAVEQTVRPVLERHPDAKRWYTITPQYVFGDGLLSAAESIFKEEGLEHVGNSYHSLTEREFSGYLANAMAAKPDALLLLNFGAQCSDTIRQAVSFGLKNNMLIVVAWSSGLEQFESLGADLCEDIYFGAQYWHTVDTPVNQRLLETCREAFDITPNYSLASALQGTEILIEAIRRAESADQAAVIAALEGAEFDGLTGAESMRAADHQTLKDYYLLKGKAKSAMEDADDYMDVISSGKSFLAPEDTGCTLA